MNQFIGGPYDGHPLEDDDGDFPIHTFDMPNARMAIYELDDDGEFRFVRMDNNDTLDDQDPDDIEPECCVDPWHGQ